MKILVTAKRVIDPELKIKIKPDNSGLIMDGMNFVVNPFDEFAIEEALRIKEKQGGEVVLVGIGIKEGSQQLRSGMAMGADRSIHVITDDYIDSDTVARILVKIVAEEKPDLILMGKQAVDFDCNQAAMLLAEYLGYGQATFAHHVEISADQKKAIVKREVDGGSQTVEIDLPGIITADLRLNEPRYASLPNIMKAKKKPIKETTPKDLGVDTTPKVIILKYEPPAVRTAGEIVPDVLTLVDKLKNQAKVL